MKRVLFLMAVLLLPILAEAQTAAINRFYRAHKKDKGTINMVLPGWLFRLGASVARPFVDDDEIKSGLRLVRKVRSMRFLVSEDQCTVTKDQYDHFTAQLRHSKYDELIKIQDDGTNVDVFIREKRGKIKGLLFLVREEDAFVMASMKTSIKMKDISKLVNDLLEAQKKKKAEEEKKKKSETKPRPPQA